MTDKDIAKLEEEYLEYMEAARESSEKDPERGYVEADAILKSFCERIGATRLVEIYDEVNCWYA